MLRYARAATSGYSAQAIPASSSTTVTEQLSPLPHILTAADDKAADVLAALSPSSRRPQQQQQQKRSSAAAAPSTSSSYWSSAVDAMPPRQQRQQRRRRHPVPLWYRIPLLTIEPLFALNGSCMLLFQPHSFLAVMSPLWSAGAGAAPDPASLAPVRVLTDQLAAMQFLFAFTQAFILRAAPDLRTWRLICITMLLSDVLHASASLREVARGGADGRVVFRSEDWLNFSVLAIMAALRLGVLLGIGIRKEEEEEDQTDALGVKAVKIQAR